MEREKGFEPSTPTLARLCSTPELLPHTPKLFTARSYHDRIFLQDFDLFFLNKVSFSIIFPSTLHILSDLYLGDLFQQNYPL
jgi:hypothetical protein